MADNKRITPNDGPFMSFEANVPADLVGKEGYAVEQVANTKKIQLYTGNGLLLGWLVQRLEGDVSWSVRLAGKGGTARCVAGGVINTPGYVKAQNGGTMIAANSGDKAHGKKIAPNAASAANDFIEIVDGFEVVP